MRIAIDCRMYSNSGIGTYIREILPYLCKNKSHDYLLIGELQKLEKFKAANVKILSVDISIFSLKEFLLFPTKEINQCDIYYSPNYNVPSGIRIPIYSSIHDVVFLDVNGLVGRVGKWIRKYSLYRAIKLSKKIFTVSKFSKKRIEHHFGDKKEIIVTYNGISKFIIDYKKKIEKSDNRKYIIYVGNIKKHKGLDVLLEAYSKARKEGFRYKLVIVGNQKNFRTTDKTTLDLINKLNEDNEVVFTGYVENEKLIEWIANSESLIQPSLYEGFGIPPLEAMALGVRPIISDIEVFKELYSKYPVTFFYSEDSEDLAKRLLEIENTSLDLINQLKNDFSYEKVANIIISEIEGI